MRSRTHTLAALLMALPLTIAAQLNGVYTVNPAGGGNYTTISAAVNALNTVGVSGPVTIRIVPGTYPESFTLNQINGTSATRWVWFESSTLDSTAVTIGPGADSTTIKLLDCDYVGFRYLRVKAPDRGFEGNSYPTNIEIHHCVVFGYGPLEQDDAIVFWQGRYLNIHHNRLDNVDQGVGVGGDGIKTSINDNVINAKCIGMNVTGSSDVEVRRNTITLTGECYSSVPEENAIRLLSCDRPIAVTANRTRVMFGGKSLHMNNCIGTNADRIKVANNMFVHDPLPNIVVWATTCAKFDYCKWVDVYHNSALNQNAVLGTALDLLNDTNIRIKGNALRALSSAPMKTQGTPMNSDYNLFFSPTGLAVDQGWFGTTTLAQWQALGYDLNSLFIDPLYVSATDLHLQAFSPALNKVPLTFGIVQDIDGDTRPLPFNQIADMGCDERVFTPPAPPRALEQWADQEVATGDFKVYPNPVSERLTIATAEARTEGFRLLDMHGRVVRQGILALPGTLDLSDMPVGTFLLWLANEAQPVRVVVQR
ncbi:MAG: hypothetical protein IPN38_03865 [Flavobacteriales bacterium]|nr:hypothetical protein [Flavobacteriales bacterium]